MNYSFPTIYTVITVLIFLIFLLIVAYFIKRKSHSIKKIINKKNINITEFLPVRGGYSAITFLVNGEEFFFVGHKSGNSSLVQIKKLNKKDFDNKDLVSIKKEVNEHNINVGHKVAKSKKNENKPLQHVNISDLLALHKKG